MKNNCKIVQDLLPNYIEKITLQETNEFIENHLQSCEYCKKIHENMISDLEKEKVKNTEVVKTIKKYKKRILFIKFIVIIVLIVGIGYVIGNIGFKFWIVNKAFERNTNFDIGGNYTLSEYEESIEKYENHIETYYCDGKMKKVYGDEILEYYDGNNHYYFDNENKTYYIEKNVKLDANLTIDISFLKGMENIIKDGKISKFEILKFVLFSKDTYIWQEGFRNKEYYIIKNIYDERIYLDRDTFLAERLDINRENEKEYRITSSNVNYRMVELPDFSEYKLIEK